MSRKLSKSDLEEWNAFIADCKKLPQKKNIELKVKKILLYKDPWDPILDLHGLTIQDAYNLSIEHIERGRFYDLHYVTIITGKSGIIFMEFEYWLKKWGLFKKAKVKNNGGCWIVYLK